MPIFLEKIAKLWKTSELKKKSKFKEIKMINDDALKKNCYKRNSKKLTKIRDGKNILKTQKL